MSNQGIVGPKFRAAAILAFAAGCVGFFTYLYAQGGAKLPLSERHSQYKVSFDVQNVGNLVQFGDVIQAGVRVGKADSLDRVGPQTVRVVLTLDDMVVPLHEGVVVEIIERSLLGQPAVKITDGTGLAFPDGAVLPASSVRPPVTVRNVLASFDQPSRAALSGVLQSLGAATDDRQPEVRQLAAGLANFGNQGDVALAAVAAQSADLANVARQLKQVFDALDVGQGQIADLVTSADKLTRATAEQRPALEDTLRKLPSVMDTATAASADISRMATALTPVAADLRQAAPDLDAALVAMPDATGDVRRMLPDLDNALDSAPATLRNIPDFGGKARDTFPVAVDMLREFNPMARYIKPHAPEIAMFFATFGASINRYGEDGGSYLYVRPLVNAGGVRPTPIKTPGIVEGNNPIVERHGYRDPKPFTGPYPRVERDGN